MENLIKEIRIAILIFIAACCVNGLLNTPSTVMNMFFTIIFSVALAELIMRLAPKNK